MLPLILLEGTELNYLSNFLIIGQHHVEEKVPPFTLQTFFELVTPIKTLIIILI